MDYLKIKYSIWNDWYTLQKLTKPVFAFRHCENLDSSSIYPSWFWPDSLANYWIDYLIKRCIIFQLKFLCLKVSVWSYSKLSRTEWGRCGACGYHYQVIRTIGMTCYIKNIQVFVRNNAAEWIFSQQWLFHAFSCWFWIDTKQQSNDNACVLQTQ